MRSLVESLPLRQSTVWAGFREARTIPLRYGVTRGACLQLDDSRRLWCWADHAAFAIDDVFVADTEVGNWVWRNALDSTGRVVALVEFDSPVDEGVTVTAAGRGKPHPVTGALMDSAADVVWDLLANVAGQTVDAGDFGAFRSATSTLPVGGSFVSPVSVRDAVRQVCASIGAIFSAPSRCVLFPPVVAEAARYTVAARHTLTQTGTTLESIITTLRVEFALEDDAPTQAVELAAPEAVRAFGDRPSDLVLRFVAEPRVAVAVGTRLLQSWARPNWTIAAAGLERVLRVGDVVTLAHPDSPVAGDHPVIAREVDLESVQSSVAVRAPVGAVPSVSLVRQSARSGPLEYPSVAIQSAGTERVITLKEADGTPIAGAQVTIDGRVVRQSDSLGRVTIPGYLLPPGEHEFVIKTQDGRTLTQVVLVQ